jgi:plastocyanin
MRTLVDNHRARRWLAAAASAALLAESAAAPVADVPAAQMPVAQTPAAQAPAAEAPKIVLIDVKNFMFAPASMTVKSGATVTWTNMDQEPHTVVSSDGLFRSGAIDTGESFSFTFEKPGTYQYLCTIHPRMVGIVVVQ